MSPKPLISPNLRREAREYMVGWTLGQIADVFRDHEFVADYEHNPGTSGQRRTLVEQFYVRIDWQDRTHCERILGVFEAILDDAEARENSDADAAARNWSDSFRRMLARDGLERDDVGQLRPRWVGLAAESIESLPVESAIPTLLRRMWDSVEDDPDLAIGAAKEAIEATAKHLLVCAGETVDRAETMPSLIARSQKLLDVHPATVAPTKDGVDTIKSILGALSQAALGINALRRDYGSGHGRPTRSSGLKARHARLATQAADAWVRFMLDTSAARVAPADAPVAEVRWESR